MVRDGAATASGIASADFEARRLPYLVSDAFK
jgi:hypothetical protein